MGPAIKAINAWWEENRPPEDPAEKRPAGAAACSPDDVRLRCCRASASGTASPGGRESVISSALAVVARKPRANSSNRVYHSCPLPEGSGPRPQDSADARDQALNTHVEAARKADDRAQPRLAHRPLEPRDLGRVEPRAVGESLLRKPRLPSQPPQVRGEALLCPHRGIVDPVSQ